MLPPPFNKSHGLTVICTDKGNFYKSGINYRLRFLQKSHLPAKRVDDVLYACVFCVRAGRTLDECDATVFTTTKALFNHLSHHPRPLPEVPGIAVVEGSDMPAHLRNDYDVHFKNPPEAHPAQLNLSEIAGKATAIAKDHSRRLYGQRLLFDRSPALEICHGARVTGITWPDKYNGEWIFGWHDGLHASTPADVVKLEPPPSEEIRMVGSSLIRAKARWKFAQKDKEKDKSLWLKFDKNEPIINISCEFLSPLSNQQHSELGTNRHYHRSIPRALVLVRNKRKGQMGHLPQSLP